MIKRNFTAALIAAGMFAIAGVAQATVLDLGSSGSGSINGALFQTNNDHPTGTGVYDPFLTVQNSPWEQGYNSSVGDFDTKREPQWNHEIRFSDLQVTTSNGGFEETALIRGLTPVPEMSALFPIVGLLVAVGSTSLLRRRRMAKLNS